MVTRTLANPCPECAEAYVVKLKQPGHTQLNHRPKVNSLLCRECVEDFLQTKVPLNSLDKILAHGRSYAHGDSLIVPATMAGLDSKGSRSHRISQTRIINGVRKDFYLLASPGPDPRLMLSASTAATYEGSEVDFTPAQFSKVTALVFKNVYRSDHCPTQTTLHLGIFRARSGTGKNTEDPLKDVSAAVQEVLRDTKAWYLEGTADFRTDDTLEFQPIKIRSHAHPPLSGTHDSHAQSSFHLARNSIGGIDHVTCDVPANSMADPRGHHIAPEYGCLVGLQWIRTNESGLLYRETMDVSVMSDSPSDVQPLCSDWSLAPELLSPNRALSGGGYAPVDTLGSSGHRLPEHYALGAVIVPAPCWNNAGMLGPLDRGSHVQDARQEVFTMSPYYPDDWSMPSEGAPHHQQYTWAAVLEGEWLWYPERFQDLYYPQFDYNSNGYGALDPIPDCWNSSASVPIGTNAG